MFTKIGWIFKFDLKGVYRIKKSDPLIYVTNA